MNLNSSVGNNRPRRNKHSASIACKRHRILSGIILYTVWFCCRFKLSHRDIEDLLAERVITGSCETIRLWCIKFDFCARCAYVIAAFSAGERFIRFELLLINLCSMTAAGILGLIISDLLHTVVSHTLDDLLFLAALVLIRTVVSFFLNRQIQEVGAEIRE